MYVWYRRECMYDIAKIIKYQERSQVNVKEHIAYSQNPTPSKSFIRGVRPNPPPAADLAGAVAFVAEDGGFGVSFGVLTTGDPKTPPNMKDPRMLMPAVCQPVRCDRRLGSAAIRSLAALPI
mmetsp:Transcript_46008/g.139668  ORF Transcript_46008/g.139668 Transcript_46008/m.139668 type:complete len:122 (+) Transcript_46008:343-708(+)